MASFRRRKKDKDAEASASPSAAEAPPAAPPAAEAEAPALAAGDVDAPQAAPLEADEVMVPHAAQYAAPAGPAPPGAPALERAPPPAQPEAAKPRRPLPHLGAPLAALALLAGSAAVALEALEYVYGILLLPAAAFLLGLAALFPMRPRAEVPPLSARLRLVALALAALAMLLTVAFVEGLAAFAATGLLFSLSQLAALFVRAYPLLLGAFVVAGAMVRLAAGRWGRVLEVPRGRRALAAVLAVAALLPAAGVALAALPAGEALGVSLTVERAPFVAALSVLAGLGAVAMAALPSFAQMGDWMAREGLRRSRVAKDLALGFGVPGVLAALAGVALWVVLAPEAGAVVLGAALLLAMLAGFPAGVARFVPPMSVVDPEAAMARVRAGITAMLAAAALGLMALAAGLVYLAADVGAGDATVGAGALAAAVLVQAALALASPRFPVPAVLPERRRSVAWLLSLATLLLTFFGLLLGSGLAQGPGVGVGTGVLMLLVAAGASAGHSLLRVVLVPARRAPRPKAEKAKAAAPQQERELKEQVQRTMHLTYAAGLVFTVLMVAAVAAVGLGVAPVEETVGVPDAALVVVAAMVGVPILALALRRYLRVRRVEVELQKRAATEYTKRLTSEDVKRLTILAVSISSAVILAVFGLLTQFKMVQSLGPIDLAPKFSTDFFVFAILIGLGPYGFMLAREQARMRAIDQKFPEFLRDLAESKRAGMTLTQAVITSSKGSYGALTPDIRKMATQIEWGVGFGDALQRFARRARTPLIERSTSLIVQASEAGGNVVDILHAAAEDAREIQLLLRERKTAMSIYVMIIYIAFFVFLSVIGILDAQFLPEVAKAIGGVQGVSVGPIKFGAVDVEAFEQVFFHAAIVQALGGGFVAGVMEEGRPTAGLKHVFVMVIVGYVAFRFVMG